MNERRCGQCKITKPIQEFVKNRTHKGGYGYECKDCRRDRYLANIDYYRKKSSESSKRRKAIAQSWIADYLADHHCVDCGESDPIVLEFDHVRGEKLSHIARMIGTGRQLSLIQEEVAKCDVRCANCHRRVTQARRLVQEGKWDGVGPIPWRKTYDLALKERVMT